jgi:hypothetical protein
MSYAKVLGYMQNRHAVAERVVARENQHQATSIKRKVAVVVKEKPVAVAVEKAPDILHDFRHKF